jgi:hypothetical protein
MHKFRQRSVTTSSQQASAMHAPSAAIAYQKNVCEKRRAIFNGMPLIRKRWLVCLPKHHNSI